MNTRIVKTPVIVGDLGRVLSTQCRVPSFSVYGKEYVVTNATSPFAHCTCKDWHYRHLEKSGVCKHVTFLRELLTKLYGLEHEAEEFILGRLQGAAKVAKARSQRREGRKHRVRPVATTQEVPEGVAVATIVVPERVYRCPRCGREGQRDGKAFGLYAGHTCCTNDRCLTRTRGAVTGRVKAMWVNRQQVEAAEAMVKALKRENAGV